MHEGPPHNHCQRPPPAARYHSWLLLSVLGTAAFTLLGGAGYMIWNAVSGGGPQLHSYLCLNGGGGNGAALLRWPQGGAGMVSGTYRDAKITGAAPDEQLSTGSGALSGQVSGSRVSFDLGGGVKLDGKLAATLTLETPQLDGTFQPVACKQAGIAGWNRAVADLNAAVSQNNQREARRQAHHVAQAQTRIARDIATLSRHAFALDNDTSLGNDIQAMKNELAAGQSDLAAERQKACNTGRARADAGTVNGDLGTVQGRISMLQANSVHHDLTAVENDMSTLQSLGAAPGTGPSAAIAEGRKALSNLASAVSWAQWEGQSLNSQAQQIAARESGISNSGCQARPSPRARPDLRGSPQESASSSSLRGQPLRASPSR